MPAVYSFNNRQVKGNIDVVVILKTLEQLNVVKDAIRRNFSISEMKTAIWTDVKEMNHNLAITEHDKEKSWSQTNENKKAKEKNPETVIADEIDQKIADKLSENGRISMDNLAKEIGVSPGTAKRRYEKLKKNGVLKVTIQVNLNKMGYQAMCVFFTTTSNEKSDLIVEKVTKIPNIISIMKTSGDYDLQIYAMVQDIGQLLHIQEKIGEIPGITKIEAEILRVSNEWKQWPSPRQYISTF
ncbi:MAG: Lrp/AsnC family transcriptional regulator [Ignavibacteria bacterium]